MNDLEGLKIKKLKGFSNYFAVRKGKIRIVFRRAETNEIVDVNYRKEVYKKLK